jgi:oligogalacturonide lyase
MNRLSKLLRVCWALTAVPLVRVLAVEEPPTDWIEPATGHRVVRLSREPGSASLYFHQNAYTAEGDKLLIVTPSGLSTVQLQTRALEVVVPATRFGMSGSSGLEVGRKSRQVYYTRRVDGQSVICATHLDTKVTRQIATLPFAGTFGGVNADETLLIGAYNERGRRGPGNDHPQSSSSTGSNALAQSNLSARPPTSELARRGTGPRSMRLFSVDTRTGAVKTFHPSTNWLNHVQCSPTDPTLVLFCHEGEWHNLDRVWTLRVGSDEARLMHRRTMPYEIAGHEFFSRDGRWVWYDLQTPRSTEFWLAGVHVETGERIRYPIERGQWSVHYNISWDGKLFAGDGGGPDSVANRTPLPERRRLDPPGNGQWIYLFQPRSGEFTTMKVGEETVKIGKLEVEKLVDLSRHNYRLEPNVTFTPDGRWIVFRSNMHGPTHVYGVEVPRRR